RLRMNDERLSQIHTLARKHRLQPELILTHRDTLSKEAHALTHLQTHLDLLGEKIQMAENRYLKAAQDLSASRQKRALLLENQVTESLKTLEMQNGRFSIEFSKHPDKKIPY